MDYNHTIYESDYDDFELYVADSFKKDARAYVYNKEEDVWYAGCVIDIKEIDIYNERADLFMATIGDYTGEFILDDHNYYVGISVVGNASPMDIVIINTLKNMKLHVC